MNKVSIEIAVDENNRAGTALKQLTSGVDSFVGATIEGGRAAEQAGIIIDRSYTRGAQSAKELAVAVRTGETALRDVATAARASEIEIVRTYQQATQSARAYAEEARKAPSGANLLPTFTPLTDEQRRERTQLRKERERIEALGARGIFESPFADFSARAAAAKAQSDEAHARQAALAKAQQAALNAEVTKSVGLYSQLTTNIRGVGTPLAGITSGILGANLITAATSALIDFGSAAVDVYRTTRNEQTELINTSLKFGRQLQQDLQDINDLRNAGLPKSDAASAQAAAIRLAERAGQPNRAGEVARAAADFAAANKIEADKIDDLLRAVSSGSGIEEITGRTQKQIEASFAGRKGLIADELTETQKEAARLEAFINTSRVFNGEAAKQAASGWEQFKRVFTTEGFLEVLSRVHLPGPLGGVLPVIPAASRYALEGPPIKPEDIARGQERSDLQEQQKLSDEFFAGIAERSARAKEAAAKEAATLAETQKKIQEVALPARDAARDFLSGALTQSEKDNPFVSLFVRAQTEIAATRRQFLLFGQDFADEMARVRAESIQTEIAVARFQSQISALKSLQEARRLEQPLVGLTGPEERQLDVLQARLRGALSGTSGATTAEALRKGFTSVDPAFLARQQFDALEKLEARLSAFTGRAGGAARDAIDEQLKSLFSGLDQQTKAQVAAAPDFREKFASAFARDQGRAERDIRDAIEREQVGNLIQTDARELLKQINASGIKDELKTREFLKVTESLSERELTPDLRQARIRSLRESAVQETGREAQAERRAQKLETFLTEFDALLKGKGIKVDAPPSNVRVNVGDGLTLDRVLGSAPRPEVD